MSMGLAGYSDASISIGMSKVPEYARGRVVAEIERVLPGAQCRYLGDEHADDPLEIRGVYDAAQVDRYWEEFEGVLAKVAAST